MRPQTRYARSGDVSIAYQVIGDGPFDLVLVPGWISNVDFAWEDPAYGEWIDRLAAFSRVIVFDKRGTGLSDRDVGDSTLEERMDDLRAVLAAADSERAAVFGFSEGGALSMLFAATYPERVPALVLYGTFAYAAVAPDYAAGAAIVEAFAAIRRALDAWGEGATLELMAPRLCHDARSRAFMGRYERMCVSPRAGATHLRWIGEIDVRPVARALRVPTLVLHRADDRLITVEAGRALARDIPGARWVELPGDAHPPWIGDSAALAAEVQAFLTGTRPAPSATGRVLATVLFTDIVGSTERLVALGDRAWRDLLDRHHALVRGEIARHRGREAGTTGDGFLATFDGPARAIHCAVGIREAVRRLGIDVRAGIHIGECERVDDTITGVAVHTGARVMAAAAPGEILVSNSVRDLVAGSGLEFIDRGSHRLKGLPGEWQLLAVA